MTDDLLQFREMCWAVRIDSTQDASLARNDKGGAALFGTEESARAFCDKLQAGLESKCRVVVVEMEFEELM